MLLIYEPHEYSVTVDVAERVINQIVVLGYELLKLFYHTQVADIYILLVEVFQAD